jgi:hypothetical protein
MLGFPLRVARLAALPALVAILLPSVVVAQAPSGATAVCGDGTYSTAKTKRGACSKHGGIKSWMADEKPAAAAAPAASTKPAPAATAAAAPAAPAAKPAAKPAPTTTAAAPAPAGAPGDATAICNDGSYSHAQHHRGACSKHHGVKQWLKTVPS